MSFKNFVSRQKGKKRTETRLYDVRIAGSALFGITDTRDIKVIDTLLKKVFIFKSRGVVTNIYGVVKYERLLYKLPDILRPTRVSFCPVRGLAAASSRRRRRGRRRRRIAQALLYP